MGRNGLDLSVLDTDASEEIFLLNRELGKYGLLISEKEARELAAADRQALRGSGRIRFGAPASVAIIRAFSDCTAISKTEFCSTVSELTELFYYYKTQMCDRVGDGELVALMRQRFDLLCGASCELLTRYLEIALDNLKAGRSLWALEQWEEGVPEGMEKRKGFERMKVPDKWKGGEKHD